MKHNMIIRAVLACTSIIVSGKAAPDGRPISEGMGHVRYMEADVRMKEALKAGSVTPHFFLI